MEKYLSAKQSAEFLGIAKSCVYKWAAIGKLPKGERFSKRCTRWKESDVVKALEALKEKSAKKATARS